MPPLSSEALTNLIRGVLGVAPAWVRTELSSKDANARARAEEVMAALIVAAIEKRA
jgi:hypothetical protein